MRTRAEILSELRLNVPEELMEKYEHLPFADMADQPELVFWKELLLQADADWRKLEESEDFFTADRNSRKPK